MAKTRVSALDYIHFLVRWRYIIILNFIVICLLAIGASLIIPKTYRASATILPASDTGDIMGISSMISDMTSNLGGLGLSTLSGEGATFVAILKSRSVKDSIIKKFNLKELYKTKTMVETRKILEKNLWISPDEEGTITVATLTKTNHFSFGKEDLPAQTLARDMSLYCVELLDDINKKLRSEKARNHRMFIETRYNQNITDLTKAEDNLKAFQEQYGAVALPEQTKAAIETIAQIKGMLIAKEMKVNVLKKYVNPTHSDLLRAKTELKELQGQYDQFIYRNKSSSLSEKDPANNKDIFLPFEDIPDLGLQYARFYRDVMIQQKIQEFLLPVYEQAKIQEAKDTPSIQILDNPIIPDKKYKPKRAYIVLFAGFTSLLFAFIASYLLLNLEMLKTSDVEKYKKIMAISSEFKLKK